jgi:hypothetical protein
VYCCGTFCRNFKILNETGKYWSSMSFQNLVRLSQIKKFPLPDYAHVNKVSKKFELLLKKLQLMSYNIHDDRL